MTSVEGRIEQFEAICRASPDAILLVDVEGRITFANGRVSDMFGYDASDLVGEQIEVLVPEAVRDVHVDQRAAFMADPETRPMGVNLDLLAQRKDGTTVPVDISLSPIESDGALEVMASVRDVTDQVALRKKYRTILETAPDAIFVADATTGEIIEVNARATELLGYTEDELVGMHQSDLHPPGEADRYRDLFEGHVEQAAAVYSRFPDGSDIYAWTAEGDRIPVEINAEVFELGDQRYVTGAFRDVSTRRVYERRLEREIDRLEGLAGILSHDVRSPLTVAEGYTDLARETGDLSRLGRVEDAHDRVREIIESILTMIEQGHSIDEASLEPAALEAIASESWEMAPTSEATLEVADSGILLVDPERTRHVFENLFRNSVDHGDVGVTVTVGRLEDGFYVEDDGKGIPGEKRETVFEPRYTTSDDGSGFGLAIVREIAEAHGWSVAVTESTDGGARFEFTGVSIE